MRELQAHGVRWMLISTDPYHLRCIPAERIARGLAAAEAVFGAGTTMGLVDAAELERRRAVATDAACMAAHVRAHPPTLVGRAWESFASSLPTRPLPELDLETGWGLDPQHTCDRGWDPCWEIHVDPYGNVQTNCGILLGSADAVPLPELLATWHQRDPILQGIARRGVAFVLETARACGFEPRDAYASKCHLCTSVRRHLRARNQAYRSVFGPDEVYRDCPEEVP